MEGPQDGREEEGAAHIKILHLGRTQPPNQHPPRAPRYAPQVDAQLCRCSDAWSTVDSIDVCRRIECTCRTSLCDLAIACFTCCMSACLWQQTPTGAKVGAQFAQ